MQPGVAEQMVELAATRLIFTLIDRSFDRHTALTSEALEVTGATNMPPVSMHETWR